MRPALAVAFFIAGTLAMAFFYREELLLLGIMSAASALCLSIDNWRNLKPFLIATAVGGVCENLAVMLGAWSYSNANFLFAPLWLPVGWGMAVVLLEEGFSAGAHLPRFSKRAVAMAFGGTIITALSAPVEMSVAFGFLAVTAALLLSGYYHRSEVRVGLAAALLGTAMESACIISGNWQYSFAALGTPLWLPLCWFNAFLIMRRIIRY